MPANICCGTAVKSIMGDAAGHSDHSPNLIFAANSGL
jgi:hypothetical protein